MKTYHIADPVSKEERDSFGLTRFQGIPLRSGGLLSTGVKAILTGEKRAPRKGEWYISGAIPEAYKAPNDLSTAYHIARLVRA